ncbi:transposase [Maribacter sp. X9]|uniref:transposase n=1 Tax=Maribacter sp. X9 TaxID=3402159 RepID=UPI003AF38E94
MEIVPYIPLPKRGFAPTAPLYEIINAAICKMKTGVQWEYLSPASLFGERVLSWQSVYHHYRKWCLDDTFLDCWTGILHSYGDIPDFSSVDLDDSHTLDMHGGEAVDYQGGNKRRATNALYLTERQLPLVMLEPVAENHNDLFEIEVRFEVVAATLEMADIKMDGLFVNADIGFDSRGFRTACVPKEINADICFNKHNGSIENRDEYFDQDPYDERY